MLGTLIVGHKVAGAVYSANRPLFLLSWISNRVALPSLARSKWLDNLVSQVILKTARPPYYTRLESLEDVRFEPDIDPDRLTIYADTEWLDWRYLQSPFQYAVLAVGDPKQPDAVAIVRTASNKTVDGREVLHGYLMDVIKSSGAPSNADIRPLALASRGCESDAVIQLRVPLFEALSTRRCSPRSASGQNDLLSFNRAFLCERHQITEYLVALIVTRLPTRGQIGSKRHPVMEQFKMR